MKAVITRRSPMHPGSTVNSCPSTHMRLSTACTLPFTSASTFPAHLVIRIRTWKPKSVKKLRVSGR